MCRLSNEIVTANIKHLLAISKQNANSVAPLQSFKIQNSYNTHHQFRETCMQLLGRGHGGAELQQLQRHAVLQVDLRWLGAAEAAEEAQARPRPLPGGHDGRGDTGGSGGPGR